MAAEAKVKAPEAAKAGSALKALRGRKVGRYILRDHLASGGMAEIFLAKMEAEGGFEKEIVLKILQARFADNAEVVEMFREEARLGAELRHPSIVDVYDTGEDGGLRYIAMEYIEGKTLTELVLRAIEVGRPLPLTHAAHILGQVADGLAYLQEGIEGRGRDFDIVHRDISPTNLVVSLTGQTKIIDFGIARRGQPAAADASAQGGQGGKLGYMSPEQVKGQPLDGRSDIFSLGTILYEITLGQRLWRGPAEVVMRRIVEEKPAPPTYVNREYPPGLELIVLRALEKRPEDRYQSAAEMAEDLEAFLADAVANGERVSNRQIARYVQEIFSPDAALAEGGAQRARAFMDEEDAEPLDFDRKPTPSAGAALARALKDGNPLLPAAEPVPADDRTDPDAHVPVISPAAIVPLAPARAVVDAGPVPSTPAPRSRKNFALGIAIAAAVLLSVALTLTR